MYCILKKNLDKNVSNVCILQSKFTVLFPKYQENCIKESWKTIKKIFFFYKLKLKLNLKFGFIEVSNDLHTRDPFVIIKARDFIKLISRSVPIRQAAKIFDDQIFCDIIKISRSNSNKSNFLKKRKNLIGKKGILVKIIEIITQCYLIIQGNTVSCMGKYLGIKYVRNIVENSTFKIHPILYIKMLIMKQKLYNILKFNNQNWEKYLPSFDTKKLALAPKILKNPGNIISSFFQKKKKYEEKINFSSKKNNSIKENKMPDSFDLTNIFKKKLHIPSGRVA
nr:rev-interacting protein Rip-1-like protein [Cryptomonas paramecium]